MPLSFSRYSSEARIKARARSICRRTASSDSPKKGSALFLGELDILLIPPRHVIKRTLNRAGHGGSGLVTLPQVPAKISHSPDVECRQGGSDHRLFDDVYPGTDLQYQAIAARSLFLAAWAAIV